MEKLKNNFKSVRFRLFLIMCIVIAVIVICLIIVNSVVLESFYIYSKTKTVRNVYTRINNYYNLNGNDENLEEELRRIAFNNNFDIFIETEENVIVFSTDRDLYSTINFITSARENIDEGNIIYHNENIQISRINDKYNNISYILLSGRLDNGYNLYISIPAVPIEESVQISNQTLIIIGIIILLISSFIASIFLIEISLLIISP